MAGSKRFRDRADDGLLSLVGEVPELVRNLVVAEVNAGKAWFARVFKDGGMGAVWFFIALFFLFWTIPAFAAFVIVGLASWWPWWVSTLAMVGLMLVFVAVFALLGIRRVKRLTRLENPVQATKRDVVMVKDIANEL